MKFSPKRIVLGLGIIMATSSAFAAQSQITGAGSSFVYPIMAKWGAVYSQTNHQQVNYQAIGSGGGLSQLKQKTIQFAGVDMPLDSKTLQQRHWMQFPIVSGGIVLGINVPGIKTNQLTLNGPVVSQIFLGKITQWNDPQIKKLNPHLKLPNKRIIVVHRADGSGTTYNFASYLAATSPTWKKQVGVNTSLSWPTGIGAKGNSGVAMMLERVSGSIGYIGYDYAASNHIPWAAMINHDGKRVKPSLTAFTAAAKNANWKKVKDFDLLLVNQPGRNSWPITASTFILLPQKQANQRLFQFFDWCYTKGARYTKPMQYVAIPSNVVTMIHHYWKHA